MEFVVQRTDLLRELSLGQRIVEKRNTIPILANLLVEASPEGLSLTSTDLEVGLRSGCVAEVKAPGAITVSAKKLFEVVRSLPEEQVRIRSNDTLGVVISCARAEFRLVGLDAKDFPNLPACDMKSAWESPSAQFHQLLSKVLFAVTTDESRFPISGVLFLASKKHVTLVATDGHRLAIAEVDRGLKGISAETRLVMPKKALSEVKQIAEMGSARIACEVKENHIFFKMGERLLVARMVEDQFPAYEKVIPRGNENTAIVAKGALDGAVRRASVLSSEKARAVRLQFKSGSLIVSASNPELGEAHEELEVEYQGDPFDIAFNAQYLLDFLGVVGTERVRMELKDGSTQAILRPEESGGETEARSAETGDDSKEVQHHYVLMPMRL
jgi:DNA polymerase-3 subunit beta